MAANIVPNLLEATKEEKQEFLNSFEYVLADCDGTIWDLGGRLEGAGAAIKALQDRGKHFIYLTNNSMSPNSRYQRRFADSGIIAKIEDVMHPGIAAVEYLKRIHFDGLIYLIGSPCLRELLTANGFNVVYGATDESKDSVDDLMSCIDDKPVEAVIVDADFNVSLKHIWRAESYLKKRNCLFLAGATDVKLPLEISLVGPGAILKLLEEAAERRAIVVGKPGLPLKEIVLQRYNIKDPTRILVIGDTLEQDIGFGNVCGFKTLVVLTGATTKASMEKHEKLLEIPQYYLPCLADFVKVCADLSN